MPSDEIRQESELVLPPNTFAYVLDTTKGKVSAYVGPYKNSLSQTDQMVVWESQTRRFDLVGNIANAIKGFAFAAEGEYIILTNPAVIDSSYHPPIGNSTESTDLDFGRQVIVPGPVSFPLWPGQDAQTIKGHHLRHNQYLSVRVRDPEQARANWGSAVVAPQVQPSTSSSEDSSDTTDPDKQGDGGSSEAGSAHTGETPSGSVLTDPAPERHFSIGQVIVIKGTDVSFYIPPTGVEVVEEEQSGKFVREAATLERLEYCILLDESGDKRYVQGPEVVFPEPTESFVTDRVGNRKFKAIELNPQSGLYIKVIAPYEDDGVHHRAGEELFITGGGEDAIYFPRPEHSLIQYGDQLKHHAVAIPAGEGRYVLDRTNGNVGLTTGPKMFLPDPRTQVVVRRVLDPKLVEVLYPGNDEALGVNRRYAEESGLLSPGELLRSAEADRTSGLLSYSGYEETYVGESTRRGTTYTPPRTVTLDTKYEGAVTVNVWPGYAVLLTKKTGERRVEVGPANILLEYDESPMVLALSTGRPKTDRTLLRTAYLRTVENQVSDRVEVETKDIVPVSIELSYRVRFEGESQGEQLRWFDIENYVKVLADHCRSLLRNAAKRYGIQEFYTRTIDIVRDSLLGESDGQTSRRGLFFEENGMRLYDVEVLNVRINNEGVEQLLSATTNRALEGAIKLSEAEDTTIRDRRLEELARESIKDKDRTAHLRSRTTIAELGRSLEESLKQSAADLRVASEGTKLAEIQREEERIDFEQEIAAIAERNRVTMERMETETDLTIKRLETVGQKLAEAIAHAGDQSFAKGIVEALAPHALALGVTNADLFAQMFEDTPFAGMMNSLAARPAARGALSRSDD